MDAAAAPSLARIRHWVFDLDGTLTRAAHDFALIRRELDIPPGADILAYLAALPAAQSRAKHDWLMRHERALAEAARAAPGAVALVRALHAQGCRLGILTRNARPLADVTLRVIGLGGVFAMDHIVGRDEAPPKPAPDGLHYFLHRWQVPAEHVVMVGDYRFDLECGRAAGTHTLLVNQPGDPWPGLAHWCLPDCGAVLAHLEAATVQGGAPAPA